MSNKKEMKPKEKAIEFLKNEFICKDYDKGLNIKNAQRSILGDLIYTEDIVTQAIDIALKEQAEQIFKDLDNIMNVANLHYFYFKELKQKWLKKN